MDGDIPPQDSETDDGELLRRYVASAGEEAFATLVRRHIDFVYHVALRKVGGDTHLAEDVTQRVFADLATKAAALERHRVITGWLFSGTHYAATQLVRAERRRKVREQKAHAMNELTATLDPVVDWERLRPLIDDVLHELPARDREAVLLRFFQGWKFSKLGAHLRLTEHGARACVERAVEKLNARLMRRGITSTSAALGLALGQQAAVAAPAGLAATAIGTALAAAGVTPSLSGLFAGTTLSFMSTTKMVTAIATLVTVAAIGFSVAHRARAKREIAVPSQRPAVQAVQAAPGKDEAKSFAGSSRLSKGMAAPFEVSQPEGSNRRTFGANDAALIRSFENRGKNSAEASLQSLYWASNSGDVAMLASLIALHPNGARMADELYRRLPPEVRARQSSDEVMALWLTAAIPEIASVRFLARTAGARADGFDLALAADAQYVTLDVSVEHAATLGTRFNNRLVFRSTPDGWRWVVPTDLIARVAQFAKTYRQAP